MDHLTIFIQVLLVNNFNQAWFHLEGGYHFWRQNQFNTFLWKGVTVLLWSLIIIIFLNGKSTSLKISLFPSQNKETQTPLE